MPLPSSLSHITDQVQHLTHQHLSCLSLPQQNALADFTLALLQGQDVRQNHLSRHGPLGTLPDSFERRFQRFLANKRLDMEAAQKQFARWVLSLLPPGEVIVLLVDETSLSDHVRVMALCLAYRGRALPLAWECYDFDATRGDAGQVETITTLLARVQAGVPQGTPVVVEADRGIGCSPDLLKAVVALGWYYLVRVQKSVHVCLPGNQQKSVPFATLLPQAGAALPLSWGRAFKKAGWLDCGVLGCFESGYKDAWCLVTNYPGATCRGYAVRMWVEACFKDLKSSGWQWQRSQLRDAARVSRLWLVMALASAFALLLGTLVESNEALRRVVTRGKGPRQSLLVWGVRLVAALVAGRVPQERLPGRPWKWVPGWPPGTFKKTVVQ